ncbi:MAG: hypothetical protein KIT09_07585 [Bryobacteraceae bacterium]|nr:hypothetical protein [Bryobacteraceae bacterium]
MNLKKNILIIRLGAAALGSVLLSAAPRVVPTPQQFEAREGRLTLPADDGVEIVIGEAASPQVRVASELLASELALADRRFAARARIVSKAGNAPGIVLWDYGASGEPPWPLAGEDRELLDPAKHFGQSYLLETRAPRQVWIAGSTSQGVLHGAATLAQLFERVPEGLAVPGCRIRDYPDFRYRAAADWLLRAELNRWAYDWGDGRRNYIARIKRKLDFCARFKINMALFDGFGWTAEKRPGHAAMMRELGAYARARGIKLMYTGFGANFDPPKVEPEFNIGKAHLNRESYPHGRVYSCFGETRTAESPTYGTCRSNEGLNAEIAREFETFVRAVEPGALYIHHEDTGHFDSTQIRWAARCERCQRKWPNPDFAAADGGAGAMAHGYANIFRAIRGVKNPDTGYDAARDCTVVFISPPYGIDSGRSGLGNAAADEQVNWNKTLEFWSNVLSLMPAGENLEIGFREIFPNSKTGEGWIEAYRRRMAERKLNPNVFLFFLGGADQYSAGSFGYPFTGNSAMNALYLGAEAIYNFNGGLHQEPQQLLNAEYGWNARAPGSYAPKTFQEGLSAWNALMDNERLPPDIFGEGRLFDLACRRVYGEKAGEAMSRFFRYSEPAAAGPLPRFYPRRIYPLVVLWRYLQGDSLYWNPKPDPSEEAALKGLGADREEFHRRLAAVWRQTAGVNRKAAVFAAEAERSLGLRPDADGDVRHLARCLDVGERFANLLAAYHELLAGAAGGPGFEAKLKSTLEERAAVAAWVEREFQFDHVDPKGGDLSSWIESLDRLRSYLQAMRSASHGSVK